MYMWEKKRLIRLSEFTAQANLVILGYSWLLVLNNTWPFYHDFTVNYKTAAAKIG